MASDTPVKVSRPKIQRLPPLPPAETVYHRIRKRVHLICFLIFIALPFFNVMRFDIPRQRFYFAGFELWINEFAIIFFALMFLMFLIAASAILYGRIYCGYACPQMIFSEWSCSVENWAQKTISRRFPRWTTKLKSIAAMAVWWLVLGGTSVFLAYVFTSYFVEPRDLLARLFHFDLVTAGGITGATVTLITFLDFALVRQRFCTTVCPYGYLQGILQDNNSLLVVYHDGKAEQKVCIECGKCVRVCEMNIDIRNSPHQIECVHCGDCIDACEDVLRRIGRTGLIHYAWGEVPNPGKREPLLRRLGFRDAKRVAIIAVLLFYFCGLVVALSMRQPVLVRIAPDRTTLYQVMADGRIVNRMRIKVANRSGQPATIKFWIEGLPGAELVLPHNPVILGPSESFEQTYDLRVRPWPGAQDVNHFRIVAQAGDAAKPELFDMTFVMPTGPRER